MKDERNDSPLRWKIQFEGDLYDHNNKLQELMHLNKMVNALHEIKHTAKCVLKHGDDTKEQYSEALEEILEASWWIDCLED